MARVGRFLRGKWLLLFLALLGLSYLAQAVWRPTLVRTGVVPSGAERIGVTVSEQSALGASDPPALIDVTALRWRATAGATARAPVILLHGSPSVGAQEFAELAPLLAQAGHDVLAFDLPGSLSCSARPRDYSIAANARLVLAALDAWQIERTHVVGWSMGGGSALWMAHLAPQRTESITLMASIGMQETEGSGDYRFERFKYRLGQIVIGWIPQLVPHFGRLGTYHGRTSFLRNFLDTDLRPMRAIMEGIEVPTLILHGRRDFLTPAWGAREHHKVLPRSQLVMLDEGHFLPVAFGKPERLNVVAGHLCAFLSRAEQSGALPPEGAAELAGADDGLGRTLGQFHLSRDMPWWAVIAAITAASLVSEDLTVISVGLLIVDGSLDMGVGLLGCFLAIVIGDIGLWMTGRFIGRRVLEMPLLRRFVTEQTLERYARVYERHTGKAVMLSRCLPGTRMPAFLAAGILLRRPYTFFFWVGLAALVWTPFLLFMTALLGPVLLDIFRTVFHGPWALIAAIIVLYIVIRAIEYETTPQGRDRLKADLKLIVSPEFWPAWLFYLPFAPVFAWLGWRHGGLMTFSHANPGISHGGGLVGESKREILDGLRHARECVAPAHLVEPGPPPPVRATQALEAVRNEPALRGFPIILKPDCAERGAGLRVARSPDDVRAYFERVTGPALVQALAPGTHEAGLLWARVPTPGLPVDRWPGRVFSVTRKTFPVAVGDGRRTLERLIWDHPRLRMQAGTFLKRFEGQCDRVLDTGEVFPLAFAGNHCQGTMFTDGSDLLTPALEARLEEIAQGFTGLGGGRLDFGRFDIRYTSDEALHRGEGFTIVELNGTSSESTNMYDPTRSLWWSYRLLAAHWSRLFQIGAARRREGARRMGVSDFIRAWRGARRRLAGLALSD